MEKALLHHFKKLSKAGDPLEAISDRKTNEERVSCHPWNILGT